MEAMNSIDFIESKLKVNELQVSLCQNAEQEKSSKNII